MNSSSSVLSARLSDQIADLILSGEFPLGSRLEEQVLADRFGVSRTPIREALRELAASGLVEIRSRRPATVRELGLDELADLFEAMGEVEALCARYAAERMTQAERLSLRRQMDQAEEALRQGDSVLYRRCDAGLHRLIHAGAHNVSLKRLAEQMRGQTAVYSSAPYTMPNHVPDLKVPHGQHKAVVEAILEHDAASAQRLMVEHIGFSFLTVQSIIGRSRSRDGAMSSAAE